MNRQSSLPEDIIAYMDKGKWLTVNSVRFYFMNKRGHYCSDVEVRDAMRQLNQLGYSIVSGPKGFMWTDDVDEIRKYEDNLKSRIRGLARRLKHLREIRKAMGPGQTTLNI